MNRNRLLLIGVLALTIGAFVSMVVYKAMKMKVASVKEANTTVVVAAQDIPVGQKLTARDMKEIKLPGGDLPTGYYPSAAEIEGRGVIQSLTKGIHSAEQAGGAERGRRDAVADPARHACRIGASERGGPGGGIRWAGHTG